MFTNYFKTAFRSLWKNRLFSGINIIGLTIGISCCLLIGLYIKHELSYDDFQEKGSRTVRVIMEYSFGENVTKGNFTSTKVAPAFKKNFPEVESAIRLYDARNVVKYNDRLFNENGFVYADSNFFNMFTFPLLSGDPRTALQGPDKIVLTRSSAKKYFGDENPIGKTLAVGSNARPFVVTGITADCPSNSQIKYNMLASFSSLGPAQEETYWNANYTTYLLLKNEASIASLQSKIPAFMKKEMGETSKTYILFHLEPMKSIHLYSPYSGFEPNSSITYIWIIIAAALLMLAIACFTYINLGTASSMERAREVGIRKVLGAAKNQLFYQYIGESFLLCAISLVLSILVLLITLPYFNQLADKQLSIISLLEPVPLALTLFVLGSVSFLAGSYPALVLAGFNPVKVLKGSFKNTRSGLFTRKSLIVFQFVISVFLIVCTFVIQNQLHYIQHSKLGYNREHTLIVPMDQKILDNIDAIKTGFKTNPGVLNISRAMNPPTKIVGGYNMRNATMPEDVQINVKANPVDEEFIKTTGLQLIAGTDFSRQDILDLGKEVQEENIYHYVINETAARQLGLTPQQAVGQKMFLGNHRPGLIKGVVKDFNFESLHTPIGGLVLFPEPRGATMLIKLSGQNMQQTIASLENKWKELIPHRPFDYSFLDEVYNKMYSSEIRLGKVMSLFSGIAILLACMGLFGLSAYAAQQRVKEIGIRKVLGASVINIIATLSKEFVILSGIAALIAFPAGWWIMHKWLEDFSYRTTISAWTFILAGALAVIITIITVSLRAVKAALANPVKSLRTE
ncbi:ABC transporter permease [Sediminibacterium ginsengisoli]|uniref:Putative ABC transport system permease protein n=1 Tax=Sediminibacterium ginsengisoli TaxID=413434 RepID=A0A1T4PIB9_9BACT|nr:ABC transporter permease [Sediminibacterium ginsengisoli]SJZ91294.1 putative ABC transport system permease protein [Sediminibacterium ginsengisoli]